MSGLTVTMSGRRRASRNRNRGVAVEAGDDPAEVFKEEFGMLMENPLDLDEIAYLCGGPRRAALTTVLTLLQHRVLRVSPGRHRIRLLGGETTSGLERAVVDALPGTGLEPDDLFDAVASSPAMRDLRASLVERGLLHRWRFAGRTARGRRLRRHLRDTAPAGLERVAASGPKAIPEAELRAVFAPAPMVAGTTHALRGTAEQSGRSVAS